MIAREELLDLAADFGLAANVVEKDYALGWLLAAVGQHAATRDSWLFRGGTCLKKCFFETYRFSEDLDFTLLDAGHLDEAFLAKLFDELAAWVYERTGLDLPSDTRKVEVYTNSRGGRSAEGRIGYRGPLARRGDAPRIKLDLTSHERMVRGPCGGPCTILIAIDPTTASKSARTHSRNCTPRNSARSQSASGHGISTTQFICIGAKSSIRTARSSSRYCARSALSKRFPYPLSNRFAAHRW